MQSLPDDSQDCDIERDSVEQPGDDETVSAADSSAEGLAEQLQYNLAAFFVKMQTILRVSERAIQEVIEHVDHLFSPSESVVRKMSSRY